MSGQRWTEYALRYPDGTVVTYPSRAAAESALPALASVYGVQAAVVGRTVTATDWLPLTDGAA